MPKIPTNSQDVQELRRKLQAARASLGDLESTIEAMETNGIKAIEATHVGQMDRALQYLLNFATGARKGYLAKLHAKP